MLSPYQIPHFIRYLDGIDAAVSARLSRKVPASETTLTEEFLALMDEDAQRREGLLKFSAKDLQAAIAKAGDMLDVNVTITACQHSRNFEAYVSQADFGLILEYQNTILPVLNWKAAYLMQAKRLFPDNSGAYSAKSEFTSTSSEQDQRIRHLIDILGDDAVKYCLYTPQVIDYEEKSAAAIRSFHTKNLSGEIYDYAVGLALHASVRDTAGINSGIWISAAGIEMENAASLHARAFKVFHPFTWFLLQHFGPPSSHQSLEYRLNRGDRMSQALIDRVARIAAGDPKAAQTLIDELGDKARDIKAAPERMKVLPAYSVVIRLRSGPSDGFDLPLHSRTPE